MVINTRYEKYGPHIDIAGKHEVKGLRWVFENVEMPIVVVTAEMELAGVKIDTAFGERLKLKYTNNLAEVDAEIEEVLKDAQTIILDWKRTPEASARTRIYVPKKTKMTPAKIETQYPNIDEKGLRYKVGKAKIEQIDNPINLASPVQLAILFYDIFGVPQVSKKSPRGTGKDELEAIDKKLAVYLPKQASTLEEDILPEDFEADFDTTEDSTLVALANTDTNKYRCAARLCSLILKRRGIVKLITTYIDVIPDLVKHWPDGRIRFHLNSLGTDTGRYSSGGKLKFMENEKAIEVSGINIQNIPSHNPEVRMLFTADTKEHVVDCTNNYYLVPEADEVETVNGWKYPDQLQIGDSIISTDGVDIIKNIVYKDRKYFIYI
jgi:DNA polymerase I-like protein with 3'-5' exonuclease and polymerase domains